MNRVPLDEREQRAADAGRYARIAFIALAVVLLPTLHGTAAPSTFVGLQLPPYPGDCKISEGAVLGSGPPYRYGYEHLVCGKDHFVTLQRIIGQRGDRPLWQVVDEARPSISPDERFWGVLTCVWAPDVHAAVFAIGTVTREASNKFVAGKLTQAWRFDLEAEKIKIISASDVSCAEENDD